MAMNFFVAFGFGRSKDRRFCQLLPKQPVRSNLRSQRTLDDAQSSAVSTGGRFRDCIIIKLLNYASPASSSLAIHFLLSGLLRNCPRASDATMR